MAMACLGVVDRWRCGSFRLWGCWGRAVRVVAAIVVVLGATCAISASAQAEDCGLSDLDYNASCGPEYESPAWGDAAGWTNPSQYSTIKLADITGNGQDELLARNDDGLEIWRFDTSIGEWRPAIGADGYPEVLKDFRSPLPSQESASLGANPMTYSSIQTADVLGNGTESIVAQFPDGVHTYDYTPPKGTKSIDGGTWHEEPVGGPSGNLPPSTYLTMRIVPVHGDNLHRSTVPATLVYQNAYYVHSASGGWQATGQSTLAPHSSDPKYYLDSVAGEFPREAADGMSRELAPVVGYRTADGFYVQQYDRDSLAGPHWRTLAAPSATFADSSGFGADPSRYETLRMATDLLGPDDDQTYALGRLADGLHVDSNDSATSWDTSIPALTALKDPANGSPPPGEWSSIRTGAVTADGHDEVLDVIDGQLKAWELKQVGDRQYTWTQLPADVSLNLGQAWESNASYYSTLQAGPVAGSGYPDGVIARGPFGIRTWFYCSGGASKVPGCASLQGKSGWTSWLPQGTSSYPQFTNGQAAAWTALNKLAHDDNLIAVREATVRDAWTVSNKPADQLMTLSSGIVLAAKCSGAKPGTPTTYGSCTAPAGSTGFTDGDWTAVVNEIVGEIFNAEQVDDYYDNLANLRRDVFLAEGATLPAVGNVVQALQPAAGNSSEISPQSIFSTIFGIAGSIAGLVAPEAGAALSVASYAIAMIPSATPDLTVPPFNGTFADLQNRFASAVGQADKAEGEQSYEVRQNWGLLSLIGQLTGPAGAWNTFDDVGIKGAMEEGYAFSLYKQLLPTVYDRYIVGGCFPTGGQAGTIDCSSRQWVGSPIEGRSPNFFTLQLPPSAPGGTIGSSSPCRSHVYYETCDYTQNLPDPVATLVWGPVQDTCNYNGRPATQWTYGDPSQGKRACNLGVNPVASVYLPGGAANGWNFTNCTGNPVIDPSSSNGPVPCSKSGLATMGADGAMQLTASVTVPRSFAISGATLVANRTLYEPNGAGELLSRSASGKGSSPGSGHGLGAVRLTLAKGEKPGGSGGKLLISSAGEPAASLELQPRATPNPSSQLTTMHLALNRVQVAIPEACEELPAAVSMTSPQFVLDTSLALSNGHQTKTFSIPTVWTCVRNQAGAVTRMHTAMLQVPAQRPGLAVSIVGPRTVISGSVVTYSVRVHNTRRGPVNREISSLWNVRVQTGRLPVGKIAGSVPVVRRLAELRRSTAKTLQIRIHIPAVKRGSKVRKVCISALATADSAAPATATSCAAIRRLPARRR
jgi:hypothetical protein